MAGFFRPSGVITKAMAEFVTGKREALGWMECCIRGQSLKKVCEG